MELLECGHKVNGIRYGTDERGNRHCYDCCADKDKQIMRESGRITLYLTHNRLEQGRGYGKVTNWPSSLSIPCYVKRGRHNIARFRYDVWFKFEGREWHGVQYGDNTQLCHCKQNKPKEASCQSK